MFSKSNDGGNNQNGGVTVSWEDIHYSLLQTDHEVVDQIIFIYDPRK